MKHAHWIIVALLTISCQPTTKTSTVDVSAPPTQIANPAPTASLTPLDIAPAESPTGIQPTDVPPQSTPTVTPALPTSGDNYFDLESLMLASSTDCILPCWNDLIPGQSQESDVRRVIQKIFSINISELPDRPFTDENGGRECYKNSYAWYIDYPEGYEYDPILQSRTLGSYYLTVTFEKETHILQHLKFMWSFSIIPEYELTLTPLALMQQQGVPDKTWITMKTYGSQVFGYVQFLTLYEEGVIFEFVYDDLTFDVLGDSEALSTRICFGDIRSTPLFRGAIHLLPPSSFEGYDLSEMEPSALGDLIIYDPRYYRPIEEALYVSMDSVLATAGTGDACIIVTRDYYD